MKKTTPFGFLGLPEPALDPSLILRDVPSELSLFWVKQLGGQWYPFNELSLEAIKTKGVYIIWKNDGTVVRVGQGTICERLNAHQNDPAITGHSPMFFTWAQVSDLYMNGVERYLAEMYKPLVGSRFPNVRPIRVNLAD